MQVDNVKGEPIVIEDNGSSQILRHIFLEIFLFLSTIITAKIFSD